MVAMQHHATIKPTNAQVVPVKAAERCIRLARIVLYDMLDEDALQDIPKLYWRDVARPCTAGNKVRLVSMNALSCHRCSSSFLDSWKPFVSWGFPTCMRF